MRSGVMTLLLWGCAGASPVWPGDPPDGTGLTALGTPGAPAGETGPEELPEIDAVTLARMEIGGEVHVLGVRSLGGLSLSAVDLTLALGPGDPFELVEQHGLDRVASEIARGEPGEVLVADLLTPVAVGEHHIAAAENYPEHADEVANGDTQPYLFPKVVSPTPAISSVRRRQGELLDYEVELCFTFSGDLEDLSDLESLAVGFLLCNDLTDRAIQVLDADVFAPRSASGYTDAKSKEGFLPLGPVVIIPQKPLALLPSIQLALSVNGEERQQAPVTDMTWPPDEMVRQVLLVGPEPRWELHGEPIGLYDGPAIPRGTLFLTGTPAGVIFRPPDEAYTLEALARYALGGFLSGLGPEEYVAQSYVEELLASGTFLQSGDTIEATGTFLGEQWIDIR